MMKMNELEQIDATEQACLDFLGVIGRHKVRKKRRDELEASMSNWMMTYELIAALEPTPVDCDELRCMMHIEMERESGARPHIMIRLLSRYSTLQRQALQIAMPELDDDTAGKQR